MTIEIANDDVKIKNEKNKVNKVTFTIQDNLKQEIKGLEKTLTSFKNATINPKKIQTAITNINNKTASIQQLFKDAKKAHLNVKDEKKQFDKLNKEAKSCLKSSGKFLKKRNKDNKEHNEVEVLDILSKSLAAALNKIDSDKQSIEEITISLRNLSTAIADIPQQKKLAEKTLKDAKKIGLDDSKQAKYDDIINHAGELLHKINNHYLVQFLAKVAPQTNLDDLNRKPLKKAMLKALKNVTIKQTLEVIHDLTQELPKETSEVVAKYNAIIAVTLPKLVIAEITKNIKNGLKGKAVEFIFSNVYKKVDELAPSIQELSNAFAERLANEKCLSTELQASLDAIKINMPAFTNSLDDKNAAEGSHRLFITAQNDCTALKAICAKFESHKSFDKNSILTIKTALTSYTKEFTEARAKYLGMLNSAATTCDEALTKLNQTFASTIEKLKQDIVNKHGNVSFAAVDKAAEEIAMLAKSSLDIHKKIQDVDKDHQVNDVEAKTTELTKASSSTLTTLKGMARVSKSQDDALKEKARQRAKLVQDIASLKVQAKNSPRSKKRELINKVNELQTKLTNWA